jgi:hypothetical protein
MGVTTVACSTMSVVGAECRGIVDVSEDVPTPSFSAWTLWVCAACASTCRPFTRANRFAAKPLPRIERLHARCAELGWQLDFLTPGWLTSELMPALKQPGATLQLGAGMFLPRSRSVGFQQLLTVRNGNGHCWVSLQGYTGCRSRQDFSTRRRWRVR